MIKGVEDILAQKTELIKQYPHLLNIEVKPVREIASYDNLKPIADLIRRSWGDTYSKNNTFIFCEDYLRYVFDKTDFESDMSVALISNNEIIGVSLFTNRRIILGRNVLKTGIQSALSIDPYHKNQGLAKYIHIASQEEGQKQLDAHFYWFDTTVKTAKRSHVFFTNFEKNFFVERGVYPLKVRIFDRRRALGNGILNVFEKLGITIIAKEANHKILYNGFEKINEKNIEEVTNFVNGLSQKSGCGRIMTSSELLKSCNFVNKRSGFQALGFCARNKGKISALGFGYTIDVIGKNIDKMFFLDQFFSDNEVNYHQFLKAFEYKIREQTNVYGIITPIIQAKISNGYGPSGAKLACYHVNYNSVDNSNVKGCKLLIDHK